MTTGVHGIASAAGEPVARLRVFGGLRAERVLADGRTDPDGIALGGRQERTFLALLVVHRGRPLSGERLVDMLWPEDSPPTAAKVVQVYVGRLRSQFGPDVIERAGDGYRLADAVEVESDTFERRVAMALEAVTADPLVGLDRLDDALRDTDGEPFATETHLDGIRAAAGRLAERRWQAREARIELRLRLGRVADVLAELPVLVADDPLRESLWLAWMRALALAGRRAEALATFEAASVALRDQLGVEPDAALVDLRNRIARGDPLPETAIARPFERALPVQATPFVGRAAELDDLCRLLRPGGSRIVTLTGAGGSGKTRLALEAGARLAGAFNDAVAFVDLAPAREADEVWHLIRTVLGAEAADARWLAGRRCLLILDNPERIPGVDVAVSALLQDAPRLQLLVASRVVVHVAGEETFEVEPLGIDDAAALFALRSAASGAPPEPRSVVDAICDRLDRLPLAIELAALQARALPGPELVRALGRRMPVLVGGANDGTSRHQTIEATIAWSFDALPEPARALFTRLGVFEGGWTVPAAEAVCDATPALLRTLVDHSLVRRSGDRMTMLDTIHEFAAGRLDLSGERPALLDRHAGWFAAEARRQDADAPPERQYRLLEDDIQNERLAMATLCAAPTTDRAMEMAATMWMTWAGQGRIAEGDAWFAAAAARLSSGEPTPWALTVWGEMARFSGDLDRSEHLKLEAVRRLRDGGNPNHLAATLTDLSEIARARGDLALARSRAQEAVAIRRTIGNPDGITHALMALSDVEADEGHLDLAEAQLEEGMAYLRTVDRMSREAGHFATYLPLGLARVRLLRGDLDRTAGLISDGLDAAGRLRLSDAVAHGLELAAAWLVATGDPRPAACLVGAVDALRDRNGVPDWVRREIGDLGPALAGRLGAAEAAALRATGATMTDEAAIRLALASIGDAAGPGHSGVRA